MPAGHDGEHWKNRPWLAAGVGITIAAAPVICAVGVTMGVRSLVAPPATVVGFALWWLATLALSALVFVAAERIARRALPLAVLLKMGMAFPGRAPRRLAVARRAGSVRDLHRRVHEARTRGVADEPTVAAERIVTLAASLSAHDRTTRGHAERVRALTDMIAEELHLAPLHRDRLRWSALLHDIGKLTVHPDTLNKTTALSEDEWEIIRRHPLEGARLTAPIAGWLGQWANTIAEHHERFDGQGYPFGHAGRDISLGGRIVAVADSYDVMTSARSYKRPMSPEAARLELTQCAGTQFDPDVVRAFLAVSVWRLRLAAPLSWIASMSSTKAVAAVAKVGSLSSHSLIAGSAAIVGVLGISLSAPLASSPNPPLGLGSAGSGQGIHGQPISGTSAGNTAHSVATHGGAPTSQKQNTTKASVPSTTTSSRSSSSTTTSPSKGVGSPGENTTSTTSPITTTTVAPLNPPTGLHASGQCQVVVLGPAIVVSWTPSSSPSVSSYIVLRKSGGISTAGSWTAIAQLGSAVTSYDDTSANGLGSTYAYEIEASGPAGSATSTPASAVTPSLCV